MKLRIYNLNDVKKFKKILRTKCEQVVQFNDQLKNIVETMQKTTILYNGLSVAAPQIGISKNIIYIDFKKMNLEQTKGTSLTFNQLINPTYKAISTEKSETVQGCLSIPNKKYILKRYQNIFVTAFNVSGEKFQFQASGLLSYCIQHQCDHLNGILICDNGIICNQ